MLICQKICMCFHSYSTKKLVLTKSQLCFDAILCIKLWFDKFCQTLYDFSHSSKYITFGLRGWMRDRIRLTSDLLWYPWSDLRKCASWLTLKPCWHFVRQSSCTSSVSGLHWFQKSSSISITRSPYKVCLLIYSRSSWFFLFENSSSLG